MMGRKTGASIEFSVRVVEGGAVKFESAITQDLSVAEDRKQETIEAWLDLMASGLKLGRLLRPDGEGQ